PTSSKSPPKLWWPPVSPDSRQKGPRSGERVGGSTELGIRPSLKRVEGDAHDICLVADVATRNRGKSRPVPRFERRHHLLVVFYRIGPLRRRLGSDEEKAAQARLEHVVGFAERLVTGRSDNRVMEGTIEFAVGLLVTEAVTLDHLGVNTAKAH